MKLKDPRDWRNSNKKLLFQSLKCRITWRGPCLRVKTCSEIKVKSNIKVLNLLVQHLCLLQSLLLKISILCTPDILLRILVHLKVNFFYHDKERVSSRANLGGIQGSNRNWGTLEVKRILLWLLRVKFCYKLSTFKAKIIG